MTETVTSTNKITCSYIPSLLSSFLICELSTLHKRAADKPVAQRILYKVAVTAFDCVRGTGPAYFRDVCMPTSLGGHTSVRLNAVTCWFLGPGPSSTNGASMLQPPSSGTRCLHTCAQPPSVVNSSEMGWRPISSHGSTPSSENFLFKSVYDIDIDMWSVPSPSNTCFKPLVSTQSL